MCSMCGFPAAPGHWTEAGADTAQARIRSRFRRGRLLNDVLRGYGLSAHDGGVIPGIQLQTLSGQQEIVPDLEAIWPAAERLAGRPIDPLDPRFLTDDEVTA